MTSKLTRDELNEVVSTYGKSHIANRMAVELLAAMDSEPVAYTDEAELCFVNDMACMWTKGVGINEVPLYRHAQPAPVVQCVPLGDSPCDVPRSMPSNLRELIAEEIGILFSDDDAQSVWDVCRRAAMLNGGKS